MNLSLALPGPVRRWTQVDKFDTRALELANRHYSRQSPESCQFMPPGRTLVLLAECWTHAGDCRAVWGACENLDPAGNRRFRCSIFRNETPFLSSELIVEATEMTRERWRRAFAWSGSPPPNHRDRSRSRSSQAGSRALLSPCGLARSRAAPRTRRDGGPMTVYVDRAGNGYGRMVMCHMIADTPDELHAMADLIGVARRWFQQPPKASFWHYDIAKGKRELAVAAGATDCERNAFVDHLRRIRASEVFGKWPPKWS